MLKVFAVSPKIVRLEVEGGGCVSLNVSECGQFPIGKALHHDDEGATVHVANHIANSLSHYVRVSREKDFPKKGGK